MSVANSIFFAAAPLIPLGKYRCVFRGRNRDDRTVDGEVGDVQRCVECGEAMLSRCEDETVIGS